MPDGFNETPVRGKHLHNAAAPDETAVVTLPAIASNLDPAYSEGNVVALSTDLAGNLRVVLGSEAENGPLDVDVVDRQGRILGLNRTDADTRAYESTRTTEQTTALTDNETAEHTATRLTLTTEFDATRDNDTAEATATRALLQTEFDATQTLLTAEFLATRTNDTSEATATRTLLQTEFDATQALLTTEFNDTQVVLTDGTTRAKPFVRGADVSDDNPLPVNIQSNPGALVDSGVLTDDNVAPGATTTLAGPAVGTGTGRLVEVTAHASVRMKVTLRANGVARRVFFTDPTGSPVIYQPVDRDLHTVATGEVFDVVLQNMDNLRTADLYATLSHVEF